MHDNSSIVKKISKIKFYVLFLILNNNSYIDNKYTFLFIMLAIYLKYIYILYFNYIAIVNKLGIELCI